MSRHSARKHIFNLVFQFPFHTEWDAEVLKETTDRYLLDLSDLQDIIPGTSPSSEDISFIKTESGGTFENLSQIDAIIEHKLKDWELDRLAKVDLALLRLAVYEMNFSSDITTGVAINEAVELAKIYGTDESSAFINGVLGQVALALSNG